MKHVRPLLGHLFLFVLLFPLVLQAKEDTKDKPQWNIESSHLRDVSAGDDHWLRRVSFEATHRNDILEGDDLGDTGALNTKLRIVTKWFDLEAWTHFNLYSIEIGETALDERLQFVRSHMTIGANLKYWLFSEEVRKKKKASTYVRLTGQMTEVSYEPGHIAAQTQVFLHNHVFTRSSKVLNLHYGKATEKTFYAGVGFGGSSALLPVLHDYVRLHWDIGIQSDFRNIRNSAFTTSVRAQIATAKVTEGEIPLLSLSAGFDHVTVMDGMNLNAAAEAQLAVKTSDSVYMKIGFGVVVPVAVGAHDEFDANPEPMALVSVGWDFGPRKGANNTISNNPFNWFQ